LIQQREYEKSMISIQNEITPSYEYCKYLFEFNRDAMVKDKELLKKLKQFEREIRQKEDIG